MLARNGIPIFWQFSTFGSYRWKKRKYLNYCETLIKASKCRARLSDRLLSLPPELQAEIMDYLAFSAFEDITNPTATTLRSTAQSMLKHLPAIKCEGNTVEPSDALAAIAVEAICMNIPFHFEAGFPTPQSPNRQPFSFTLAPYVNRIHHVRLHVTVPDFLHGRLPYYLANVFAAQHGIVDIKQYFTNIKSLHVTVDVAFGGPPGHAFPPAYSKKMPETGVVQRTDMAAEMLVLAERMRTLDVEDKKVMLNIRAFPGAGRGKCYGRGVMSFKTQTNDHVLGFYDFSHLI